MGQAAILRELATLATATILAHTTAVNCALGVINQKMKRVTMFDPGVDLAPLRELLAPFAAQGRTGLLPALQAAQAAYGMIEEPVAAEIGRLLHVPLADVHGVIDFYTLLYRKPVGRTIVRVCTDPACALRGADEVLEAACRRAAVDLNQTSADGAYTVERSPCLGQCNAGVSVNVTHGRPAQSITYAHVTADALDDVFAAQGRTTGSRVLDL